MKPANPVPPSPFTRTPSNHRNFEIHRLHFFPAMSLKPYRSHDLHNFPATCILAGLSPVSYGRIYGAAPHPAVGRARGEQDRRWGSGAAPLLGSEGDA